jgi:hypothetical protein
MPVNTQHPDYSTMVGRWKRCRDAADGEDAVHNAAETYLPKLQDQTPTDYQAYVMRASWYNATWRTIAGLVGMLFRKPPIIEVPSKTKPMLDDITLSGVPFQHFVQNICEEAMKCGRLGILVDYPAVGPEVRTLADAQNLRPMMQVYRAESIINWRVGRINNVWVLTQVVLKECEYQQVDEFAQKKQDVYRVLDLESNRYRVRMMEHTQAGDVLLSEVYPLMNGKPLEFIPFTFISTDDNTAEVDEPPMIDLVNVNFSHYRTVADLEHGAHFTGLPTPYIIGYRPENPADKLYIGSQSAWVIPGDSAQVGYLEFKGEGLGALERLRDSKEKQMAVLGARMLEQQKKGVETAESMSIHRKGEESMLAAAAQAISLGVLRALKWFVEWAGDDAGSVNFELNKDFYPQPMTPLMLTSLVTSWQAGAISDQTLFENLQTGDVISADVTLEQEQARIAASGPKVPPLPGDGEQHRSAEAEDNDHQDAEGR